MPYPGTIMDFSVEGRSITQAAIPVKSLVHNTPG